VSSHIHVHNPSTLFLATPKRQRGRRAQQARAAAAAAATTTTAAPAAIAATTTTKRSAKAKCSTKAKDASVVPFVLDVAVVPIDQGGKNSWLYFRFQLFNSCFSAATPKRRYGRRAQQTQAPTITTTAATTSAVTSTITALATTGTVPMSTSVVPGNTIHNTNPSAQSAMTSVTGTAATDDNPFLGSLPHNQLVYAEQPSQARQLEDQLHILSIHLPQGSSVSQSDADSTSEASAICQKP